MILGRGVAVCLLLPSHRAVIFAIAQLSCLIRRLVDDVVVTATVISTRLVWAYIEHG